MSKTVKRTTTETKEVIHDELALEGWLLEASANPEIRAVQVEKRNQDGTFSRLERVTLVPPFDQDLTPVWEAYGDGLYRFTRIDQRGKLKGGRHHRVEGYADQTRPGPGGKPGLRGGTDDTLQEVENTLRHQLRIASLRAAIQDLQQANQRPAGGGSTPLDPAERAVLQEEVFDRSLERTQKIAAMLGAGAGARGADPLEVVTKVLDLVATKFAGLGRGNAVGNLKETLELLTLAKDVLGGGGGEDSWTGVLRDLIRNPEVLGKVRETIQAAQAPPPAGAPAGYRPVAPAVYRPVAPPRPTAAPAPAPAPVNSPAQALPADHPWEVLRTTILPALLEAAAKGDRAFTPYAELIDRHLPPAGGQPGALEEFVQYEFPVTLERLAQLEPRVREPAIAAWLQEFYTFVRDDYFLPEEGADARAPGGDAGGGAAGEGEGV